MNLIYSKNNCVEIFEKYQKLDPRDLFKVWGCGHQYEEKCEIMENTISRECHIVRSWLTPHFNQNRYISIVDWNIENSRLHYHPKNQPFLAKKWLKWLKMGENTISRECHIVRSWLTPHFNQNRYISIVDWNIENSRLHHHPKNQPFLAKKWLKWLKMGKNTTSWE